MNNDPDEITRRKREHLEIAASPVAEAQISPGWEDVHLIPSAAPELSLDEVDLTTEFLEYELAAPVLLSGMTGGHEAASEINAVLAAAVERLGLGMGVGSQRAALRDPSLVPTYAVVRERAPSSLILGNVGSCQLVSQGDEGALTVDKIDQAVDMVAADGLAVHFNVLEELIQTEGDRNTSGLIEALRAVVSSASVPVVAKETGAGLNRESAEAMASAGVAALDVGGAGGTSFARVEGARAEERGDLRGARLGGLLGDWGVPTAASILEARSTDLPLIATGGIRSGMDAAKALALGGRVVGLGRPALLAARQGLDQLISELELFIEELRAVMVLTASPAPADLQRPPPVLTGPTYSWARQRKLVS